MKILLYAIPFFIVSMLCEWLLTRKRVVKGYEGKDSAASISMGIGNLGIMFIMKAFSLAIFFL